MIWTIHDILSAFDHLYSEGRKFAVYKERHLWREHITPYAVAAVAFVMQLAIECGHDPEKIRAMESELINALEKGTP